MAVTKAPPTVGRQVYQPIEAFIAHIDGEGDVNFTVQTYVREGHPILEKYGHLFRALHVKYDVEEATDRPGEPRR